MTAQHRSGRAGRTTVRATALLATAVALALAGCANSQDAGTPATPPSFQRTKKPDFSLAVPDGWQVAKHKVDGSSDTFVEARPPRADVNRPQLRVGSKRGYGGDISAATLLAQAEIATRRAGARRTLSKAIDVPGAADARRIEFAVPAGGGLAATRIVTVLALSAERTLVNVSIGVNEDDPATSRLDDIMGSLKVG